MSAWRRTAAACVLLATASCTVGEDSDSAGPPPSPSGAASSTPDSTREPQDPVLSPRPGEVVELDQHGSEYVFTKEGRYAVRLTPELVYEVDAPDMWEVYRGRYFSTSDFSGGTGVFSVDGPITHAWLPAHPCRDRTLTPVGPTARELAHALAAQPVLDVRRPKPVSIAGGRGFHVEVSIPHRVSPSVCEQGEVALFTTTRRREDWWDLSAGEAVTYWILAVDGQRFIAAGWCETTCTQADLEVLAGMAESVTFEQES
ncbi:MAG TPA: hypothetical protein VFI99_08455 [Nocardioides sp.]|nr:hypothetical protein [Nocardioides sp.]